MSESRFVKVVFKKVSVMKVKMVFYRCSFVILCGSGWFEVLMIRSSLLF